jgi:hypothetical protein
MESLPPGPIRRRWWTLGLLLLYTAALFLSALPEPVRPGFLRVPASVTETVLRRFLVRGGISVFEPPRERIVDVLRNDCIYARGIGSDGTRIWLQPRDGRCVTQGFRPTIPDLEWLLRSLLTGAEAHQSAPMQLATLGDFFCHGPPWRARELAEIELLWTQPLFQIETGAESTRNVLYFRWRCDPPDVLAEAAPPDEAQVRAFLGPAR